MSEADYASEAAYAWALESIATGETRETTRGALLDKYPTLTPDGVTDEMADALKDALASGVEREDIDPSWF